jgi:hypothetical protein
MCNSFAEIMLKKSMFERLLGDDEGGWLSSSQTCSLRFRDPFCELPEVLSGGCELELFICAFWSSQPHHRHADVSL